MFDLDGKSKAGRVAVVAVCLEHVFDFYRFGNFSLQARHAARDLGVPPSKDLLEHARDVAWNFVATGKVDAAVIDAILEGMRQPPTGADVDDMCTAGDTIVTAVAGMLKTISDPTPAQAVDALNSCASAVWEGVGTVTHDNEAGRAANDEEESWQQKVVERAVQRKNTQLSRADFADLLVLALSWQQHVAEYRTQYA